jgi:hypothetical protein
MNATQEVNLLENMGKGELVYDKDSSVIGYFTSYNPNSSGDSVGSIECENSQGESYWISGNAVYISGIGLKFVEDYKVMG